MKKYNWANLRMLCIGVALLCGGCATLSEEECRIGNWYNIGFSDGTAGRTMDRFADHQKACAKYGVSPHLSEYQAGYQKGLLQFCVPANGYSIGRSGGGYAGQCASTPTAAEFVRQYQIGKRQYDDAQRLQNMHNRMGAINGRLAEIDRKLIDPVVSPVEKTHMTYERRRLEDEKAMLFMQIDRETRRQQRAQAHVDGYVSGSHHRWHHR